MRIIERFSRTNLASGFPLDWKVKIGRDEVPEDPLRVRLKVYAWKYRSSDAKSVGAGASHTHTNPGTDPAGVSLVMTYVKGTATTYVPDDSTFEGISLVSSADITINGATHSHTQTDTGGTVLTADQLPSHDHKATMAEDTLPIVDILIDGVSFKTGLSPTTDGELIVDEIITNKMPYGDHTIRATSTQNGALEMILIVEI